MRRITIKTDKAPAALGPYSQGIVMDGWVWTAGQVALDPETGIMAGSDAATQTDRALQNIRGVLDAAGSGFDRVVRSTVYLTNMDDFGAMNEVYARYFPEPFPARACVEVSRLPAGALVEIDVIAKVSD